MDLLTRTKKLSLGNDLTGVGDLDFGEFYLSCLARDTSLISKYELWQGSKKKAESANGQFHLDSSAFEKGGDCFIRSIGTNGDRVDTRINLVFVKEEFVKETSVNMTGKSLSIKVNDNVPYLGGETLNVKFPISVPVTVYGSENKLRVGININLAGGDDRDTQFKKAKKLHDELKRLNGLKVGKLTGPQSRKFKALIKDKNKMDFFQGGEINVMGFAEADWGSPSASGGFIIQGKVDAMTYGFTTWVVVVPVTVQVGFSLDGTVTGDISYQFDTSTLDGALAFAPSAELKAFGGIGVDKLVGAGAYGSAKLQGSLDLLPKLKVNSVDLTGELGVKAYLGWLEYSHPFAYNTWHLYTGMSSRGDILLGDDPEEEDAQEEFDLHRQLLSGVFDAENYKKSDLSYLSGEKDYMGFSGPEGLKPRDEELRTSLQTLIGGTYRNAQPVIVATDEAAYAAFLRADPSTGHVYTVVSRFDGENWTSPTAVNANNTMDNQPSLLVGNDGRIWLAYARTRDGFDGESILSYGQNQEIVIGQIDPDTLAFTQSRTYRPYGYAHMHQLALSGGEPTLVYVDSVVTTDNDVLWPEHNDIVTASLNGTTWGNTKTVNSVDRVVMNLAIGEENGNLAVAVIADADGSSSTLNDKDVLLFADGTSAKIGEGAESLAWARLPGTESPAFVWSSEGNLVTADETVAELNGVTGEFRIVGNSVYYSMATEEGAQLCVSKYENGAWSLPVVLTEGDGYVENIGVVTLNGQDYVLGMYTRVSISETEVDDAKDLIWTTVTSVSDVRIEGIEYDPEGLVPGQEIPVTVEITNSGDHMVNSVSVYVNDEFVRDETVGLAIGQSTEMTVNVTCPEYQSDVYITITETGRTDYYPDDNSIDFVMGYPDLSVELQESRVGMKTTVYAVIRNEGIGSSSGTLRFTDAKGNLLSMKNLETIGRGQSLVAAYEFDWNLIGDNQFDIRAVLECDEEELYDYNNVDSLHLTFNGHRKVENPDVVLPAALKQIGEEAFAGSKFRTVRVPSGVQSIGSKAFMNCRRLEQIEIPASVISIADDAFAGTDGFVIFAPAGSAAEAYAQAHEITCVAE